MSTTDNFFATPSEKSKVKTLIVTEFLKAYFPIINRSVGKEKKEIIYIDLFCGPGKYKDGHPSTPLALLDLVNNFRDDNIRKKLRVVFNDENEKYIDQLRTIVNNHDVVSKLTYPAEIEANFFAGYILVPPVLVYALDRTNDIDQDQIKDLFNVSNPVAENTYNYYQKWSKYNSSMFGLSKIDTQIYNQFFGCLSLNL
jgi:hypothetical protein